MLFVLRSCKSCKMDPNNEDMVRAFRTFPFATDGEYQVGTHCGFRLQRATHPFGRPLTVSVPCSLIGGYAKYPSEQRLQEQNGCGEREYLKAVSHILLQQVRGDTRLTFILFILPPDFFVFIPLFHVSPLSLAKPSSNTKSPLLNERATTMPK